MSSSEAPQHFTVALATPPFPASIDDGLAWVERLVREAAERGARIVCFPESYLPGLRSMGRPVAPHSPPALEAALERARALARQHRIAVILPMDWDRAGAIENAAAVIGADGALLGMQTKNQLDPSEDPIFVPGSRRMLFEVDGVKLGVAICHEGFRYPETVRWAAARGAPIVFHPHCTGSDTEGRLLTRWRGEGNPYYESAMMCRAMENEIYFASVNYAFKFQESASCVVAPSGACVGHQPYGEPGVLVLDLDLSLARGRLARRYDARLYV